jgi:hypothetical protein
MAQLPDGAAFNDPELEPAPFIEFSDMKLFPNKSFEAKFASEPLFLVWTFSEQLNER